MHAANTAADTARIGGGARLRRFAVLMGLAALALAALAALAAWWPPAAAGQEPIFAGSLSQVVVSFADLGDSTMQLEGRFMTAASSATAWSVLTDYDHIPSFVSSMRSSRVKARGDGYLLVEQESVAKVLWFQRKLDVLLKVREEPPHRIAFDDVSKASFERYEGSWTLQDTPAGREVIYRLTVKGGLIGLVARSHSQNMVRELLEQVRAEIGRREAASRGYPGTRPSH
ncbi:MAG TPA: SRPBCC family protein [Thermoanaerobaculia bacterium]|nr:SRPBCC family protein [Thermoanaerobaculia bacterium]